MRHGVFVRGQVDIARAEATFVRRDDTHVRDILDLRKQHAPRATA